MVFKKKFNLRKILKSEREDKTRGWKKKFI